jgi:3-carboxy-cis,cis-muconate cycloisomerase
MDILLEKLFTTESMRAVFSTRSRIQRMLDFEAALARVQAECGVIPPSAAKCIESCCVAESYDAPALAAAATAGGNLAIPLVTALSAQVAERNVGAAGYVHWGATSQDVIDTALVLQLRDAFDLIERQLAKLAHAAAALAGAQRFTAMAGRTLLQQALPVTLGLKAATWLDAMTRHQERLRETKRRSLALQFGGAAGTLASLGDSGPEVAAALARELDLSLPDLPWHSQRDRLAEVAMTLGLIVGTAGKIARDLSLMMQTEIGEAFEPSAPEKGGSSTLPHKRNPISCCVTLAAATRVPALATTMLAIMVQEHERGLGGWHAEWDTLPEIVLLTAGALAQMTSALSALEVNPTRMGINLDVTQGLLMAEAVVMALAPKLGREPARRLLEQSCRKATAAGLPLRAILSAESKITDLLSVQELDLLLEPSHYLGSADRFITAALQRHSSQD